ncbi:unnamed protein product [Acanthoscelides obtectus]|uniref:SH3 domain-containing protein n=1 Tax=Acanthoscelides obtectus TaxID=200917 RepID=A0A9P0JN38_ACAOB|nr:unnamed protein product [Acanthoscelides obtectus]CAK1628872.1 E3 ubiquitin-protein ligase SH3RF1 [Acanthoscelides obtectus]
MPFIMLSGKVGKNKKKPPPRPPPPDFSKYKSKSSLFLSQQSDNLIDLDSPDSPKNERKRNIGGSVSSSFSSSTSSLASSKKSLDYDFPFLNNIWPMTSSTTNTSSASCSQTQSKSSFYTTTKQGISKNIPSGPGPTIIRVPNNIKETVSNNEKLPMPDVPPPSPPKEVDDVNIAYGIALYEYQGTEPSDLSFQANDVIVLIRKINEEWYYGKVLDKEGMFPANFIDVQVPLVEHNDTVMALYEFEPQMPGDLALKPGQMIKVLKKIDKDWLYGSCNGNTGQFPANFVDRVLDI